MSKRKGPTRIPVFGTRIPIPGSGQQPGLLQEEELPVELSNKDVGKKVRVGDKEGVLRYVGNVQFATGVWCGVELPCAVGKNNGSVRGVRYFRCKDAHGLMAPVSKVVLAEDDHSGPYSMLFGLKETLCPYRNSCNDLLNAENHQQDTFTIENNQTFEQNTNTNQTYTANQTLIKETNATYCKDQTNQTFNKDTNQTFVNKDTNQTFVNKDTNQTFVNKDTNQTFVNKATNETYNCEINKTVLQTFCKETTHIVAQETNQTFDVPKNKEFCNTFSKDTKDNKSKKPVPPLIKSKTFDKINTTVLNHTINKSNSEDLNATVVYKENCNDTFNLTFEVSPTEQINKCNNKDTKKQKSDDLNSTQVLPSPQNPNNKLTRIQVNSKQIQINNKQKEEKNSPTSVLNVTQDIIEPKKQKFITPRINSLNDTFELNLSEQKLSFLQNTLTNNKETPKEVNLYTKTKLRTYDVLKLENEEFSNNNKSNSYKKDNTITPCPKRRCCEETFDTVGVETASSSSSNDVNNKKPFRVSILPDFTDFQSRKGVHSTPFKLDFESSPRKQRMSLVTFNSHEDDANKRDSLECEESLGILTPEQMMEFGGTFGTSRTPSCENIKSLTHDLQNIKFKDTNKTELQSPNLVDIDCMKLSLLDEQLLGSNSVAKAVATSPNVDLTLENLTTTKSDFYLRLRDSNSKADLQSPNLIDTNGVELSLLDDQLLGLGSITMKMEASPNVNLGLDNIVNSENMRSDLHNIRFKDLNKADLESPNSVDVNGTDLSLLDEQLLANLTMKTEAPTNMELPLDIINPSDEFNLNRLEQTPSPEELPLDPIPIVDSTKVEQNTKKAVNSFITSITSITSLDTGYQGDGEMSRPASRGADNSPLTRRPLPRPQPRRPDPMTDSDFYTESDADNHEEHPLRGDRKAQVIDGTLYGVDPQAAADIYVNNRENMDSSGIFTDIESNPRTEDVSTSEGHQDISPSESSTKTISDNSQSNVALILSKSSTIVETTEPQETSNNQKVVENLSKRSSPSPSTVASSPTSMRSPKHTPKETSKTYRMPKRNVPSKVKAMMENSPTSTEKVERKTVAKKSAGRWDAVMNKISKGGSEGVKTNLKDVKSKVFSASTPTNLVQRPADNRKTPSRQQSNKQSPGTKMRRVRTRASTNTTPTKGHLEGSIHSSLSDVSGASPAKLCGSAKKREVVRVTQVLTAAKLSPRSPPSNQANTTAEAKKASPPSKVTKEKKQHAPKDCNRAAVKGGRVSPITRPPPQIRAPIKNAPKTAEALAILVQHLVFNLEAFSVPSLKKEIQKNELEAQNLRYECENLEKKLIEEQRNAGQIKEQFNATIAQLTAQKEEREQENEKLKQQLEEVYEQLNTFKGEYKKLQKTHEEQLEILQEENEAIREQIDEKNVEINKLKHHKFESEKLRKDYEAKEHHYKEQLQLANEEIARLKNDNERIANISFDGNDTLQEIQSLRAVLDLKQNEVSELRKSLAEASQKADQLPSVEEKVYTLAARCEDLQLQLERKGKYEQHLIQENKRLNDSFKEEVNQKKRLVQHNEELQWKLRQNKEILTKVVEQADDVSFNRSGYLSASFNERHSSTRLSSLERKLSLRERSLSSHNNSLDGSYRASKSINSDNDHEDNSPPNSPKVKGVVEKSESVSYVLDMEESPDIIASRIIRRSFRNTTPPKNTPTKSPVNKRPRMKSNPLSLSMSASAIVSSNKEERQRSRSASIRNTENLSEDCFLFEAKTSTPCTKLEPENYEEVTLDFDDDHEIELPSLPSQIGRTHGMQSLPVPKHLAGEAMVSESNSEDESTNSSSSGQL